MIVELLLGLAGALVVVALVISLRRKRSPAPSVRASSSAGASASGEAQSSGDPAIDTEAATEQVFDKLYRLAFGFTLKPTSAPEHRAVAKATSSALEAVSVDPRYIPRRPMLLPQLMKAINDEETSRDELTSIIRRDPGLAGNLLKLANTPLYRATDKPVESIDRAVAMLGTHGIRTLVTVAVLQPVFRISGGVFARFPDVAWEHSFISAGAAEAHASVVENADPFAAQLGGMLMGLGTIMVFRVTLDQYAAKVGLQPNAAAIAALLDRYAARMARRIAEGWELSEPILVGLDEQTSGVPPKELSSLGRSLKFGRLAGALGLLRSQGLIEDAESKAAMLAFGDSAPHFERMWSRLATEHT